MAEISHTKPQIAHEENIGHQLASNHETDWVQKQAPDGDVAMALFTDPDALEEPVDPAEVRKLLWKIDFMILPYLAVCYAFFYIDKVRCSIQLNTFILAAADYNLQ